MDDIAEAANECICPHGPFARRALDGTSPRLHDRGNPTACFDSCRQSFFHLVTGFPSIDIAQVPPFQEFCSKVTGHSFSPQFWQLYWCDTAFCGLWLPPNKTGEDPNVDRIINRCANFGYSSIYDPGPPPSTFSCNGLPTDGPGAPCPNHTYMLPAGVTIGVSPTTPAMAMASTTTAQAAVTDVSDTADSSGSSGSFRTPTPSLPAESADSSTHKTSAGLLAAVVVCVVAGFFVLAALVLFLVRRKSGRRRSDTTPAWAAYPPSGPGKLFRAKGGGRSASPPLTSLSPPPSPTAAAAAAPPIPYYFPSSPICAPTTNKLEPRREKNWSQETAVSPVSMSMSPPPVAAKLHGASDSEVSYGSVRSSLASSVYGHALTTSGEVATAAPAREQGRVVVYVRPVVEG